MRVRSPKNFQDLLGAARGSCAGQNRVPRPAGQRSSRNVVMGHTYWIGIPRTSFNVRFQRVLREEVLRQVHVVASRCRKPILP